jgi:protein ImuB
MALARDFSPRLERHGDACVVLDVGGLERLLGDAQGIADALQQMAADRGITIRLAVAPTQTAALLLTLGSTTVPSGNLAGVVTSDVALALAPLPLDTLQQHVTDPSRMFDALKRWGIRRTGELAALPPDEMAARFGQQGLAIQRLARGLDPRPLVPDPGVPRFIQSMELEWPIEELEPLSFVLARLLDPLALTLERADRAGAAVRLDLRLVDKTTHSRVLQLSAPMRDPRVLRTLLSLDLESHPPSAGIDVVTIEIDPAPARIVQFSLLERAIPSPETLATLTARLNALVGEDRCGSPVLLDSHRPDAFEMMRFDPEAHRRNPGIPDPLNPGTSDRRNPGRLILRRFRPPIAVRVGLQRGRPAHVVIDRRGMPGGRVEQYAGPWRSSGDWWEGESHWDRDEWDVALSDGSVCRIYRDRETERWFMDGVVD